MNLTQYSTPYPLLSDSAIAQKINLATSLVGKRWMGGTNYQEVSIRVKSLTMVLYLFILVHHSLQEVQCLEVPNVGDKGNWTAIYTKHSGFKNLVRMPNALCDRSQLACD